MKLYAPFAAGVKEKRLIAKGEIMGNFGKLISTNIQKPKRAFKDGNVVAGLSGTAVSIWDLLTRSVDAGVQGIAGREIDEDANTIGDVSNVVYSTGSAVKNLLTGRFADAGKDVLSGVSSGFQAPQSLVTQVGRAATTTDSKLAA